jgi:hypothetical protein
LNFHLVALLKIREDISTKKNLNQIKSRLPIIERNQLEEIKSLKERRKKKI